MKKIISKFVLLLMGGLFFVSCENKGPKGQVYIPEKSEDEIVREVVEAQQNDSYYYKGQVELHYLEDGDWVSAGMHDLYNYANGKNEVNDYVSFDGEKMPVSYANDYGGYTFRVMYMGVNYYY